jgi:hypothetical protein
VFSEPIYIFFIKVPMEDLQSASKLLAKALEIRERYMRMSQQEFPSSVHEFLYRDRGNKIKEEGLYRHLKRATLEGKTETLFHPICLLETHYL